MTRGLVILVAGAALAGGCASEPPAQVSSKEMAAVRKAHSALAPGASRDAALESFGDANVVKLGAATIDGVSIEEWKVEAFQDVRSGKDLFVSFLYFRDDRLVDSSDTRLNFRENPQLIERWRHAEK